MEWCGLGMRLGTMSSTVHMLMCLLPQRFDKDWMIGCVVGQRTGLGFLPTESRLREVVMERNAAQLAEVGRSSDEPLVSHSLYSAVMCHCVLINSCRIRTSLSTRGHLSCDQSCCWVHQPASLRCVVGVVY